MPILNYRTEISAEKTVGEIQKMLAKAQAVLSEYDDEGILTHLSFRLMTAHGPIFFQLPAKIQAVHKVLERDSRVTGKLRTREHAARVAWRICKDWIEAQLAIVEAEMADMVEVFLPSSGGLAAWRCALRTCSPSAAAMLRQKGGGHRCADTSTPRGRVHCRHAANPSLFAPAVPCARQPLWHNGLGQSHAAPESVRGCGDVRRSGPDGADPQPSGPTADGQLVTPIRKSLVPGNIVIWEQQSSQPEEN